MRKILIAGVLIASSLYAGCGGCRDEGTGQRLGEQSKKKFDKLDKDTAKKIDKIKEKIKKSHQDLEVQSKEILEKTQKILELEALAEKEISFNIQVINRLQNIVNTKDAERDYTK